MNPFRTVLSDALTHLITNWKTTVQSLLTIGLTTAAALLPLGVLSAKETVYAIVAQALFKAWIGIIQTDSQSAK